MSVRVHECGGYLSVLLCEEMNLTTYGNRHAPSTSAVRSMLATAETEMRPSNTTTTHNHYTTTTTTTTATTATTIITNAHSYHTKDIQLWVSGSLCPAILCFNHFVNLILFHLVAAGCVAVGVVSGSSSTSSLFFFAARDKVQHITVSVVEVEV